MALNPFQMPPTPVELWRITDNTTFIRYDLEQGFNCFTSTKFMAFNQRITPASVKDHLENGRTVVRKGLISLGTFEKAEKEIKWRKRAGRLNIWAYRIDITSLHWETIVWNERQKISLRYLTDGSADVMIFKASELIQSLGLNGQIKIEAEFGAADEWLALEWVPASLITGNWSQ